MTLLRRVVAEGLGTALLLTAVVGSGIMGQQLAGGNIALALLANTLTTGAMLVTLIFTFGPISGAHFNPAVTLADASQGGLSWGEVPVYIAAQGLGALLGVGAAHLMFGQALLQVSQHARAGGGQLLSEFIATFGLLWAGVRIRVKCTQRVESTSDGQSGMPQVPSERPVGIKKVVPSLRKRSVGPV
jgi:glycerol uptake facilitator-like aquaporin